MSNKYVVIVDPYASGNLLPEVFQKKGFSCIAVHTKKVEDKGLSASFVESDFEFSYELHGLTFDEVISEIKYKNIISVLPGVETGVQISDSIGNALGIDSNKYVLSDARRNKYLMQESIRKADLSHIKSTVVNNIKAAESWIHENNLLPVVVKPTESGGSDGVRKCETIEEVKSAIDAIIGQDNFFGLYNSEALIQEYLVAIEYVVDSVSCDGVHYVTNVAKYEKEMVNGSFLYKVIDYTYPLDNEISELLIEYNEKVLDALGIKQGPTHSEIMLTDNGPVMVETGARMHGGRIPPMLVERCTENSLLQLVVDSYIDSEAFTKSIKTPQVYKAHGAGFCFINLKSGVIKSMPALKSVASIESMFGMHQFVHEGDTVAPTKNLFTSPLWVFFANEDKEIFERDLQLLKDVNDKQELINVEEDLEHA